MKRISNVLWLLLVLSFVSSCKDEVIEVKKSKYQKSGAFIVSEGDFSNGIGTLNYFSLDSNKVFADVYQAENGGSPLGSVAQSMNIIGDNAYVVMNNSGKVVVMSPSTLEKSGEIVDLANPQYIIKGKGEDLFVSQYGSTGSDGAIKVVNSKTNKITATIDLGSGPEHMLLFDNNLYVAKSGGWGRDNKVVMINPNTYEVSNEIEVGDNPIDIKADRNLALWVLCKGHTDWTDPTNSTSAKLVKLENNVVTLSIDIPKGAGDLSFNKTKDIIFFKAGPYATEKVYAQSISATSFQDNAIIEGGAYAIDFNLYTNELFVSTQNSTSNGEVKVYNEAGTLKSSFEGGVYSGSFFFVK